MNIFEQLRLKRQKSGYWKAKLYPSTDTIFNSDFVNKPLEKEWETNPVINGMRECSSGVDNEMRKNFSSDASFQLSLTTITNKDSPIMIAAFNPTRVIQQLNSKNEWDLPNETITNPMIYNTFEHEEDTSDVGPGVSPPIKEII